MNAMTKKGVFISIEGGEGTGKSTLCQFIKQYLASYEIPVLLTREPGGTQFAEDIRQLLLKHHNEPVSSKTETLLMFASRIQHVENKILPALHAGEWVISDRFFDASFAYQAAGRGIGYDDIDTIRQWSIGDFEPDCTFLLDAPLEVSSQRLKSRSHLDRIETEETQFFERVRAMYLELAKKFQHRYTVIDSSFPKEDVQMRASYKLDQLIREWKDG
ncbi:MAG: dTMP kinase [Pseudomonadota bacterium]